MTKRAYHGGAGRLAMILAVLFAMAACSGQTPQGGLEVIIATSGLQAGMDFDAVEGRVDQETSPGQWHTLFDRSAYVPREVQLPTTLAVTPGTSPDQDALIVVTALKNGVPVVQRVVQIQVPSDRVAELLLVLAADCLGKVTLCPAGQSCQPATGLCGSDWVDPATLPTWMPGDLYSVDAGVFGQLGEGIDATSADQAETQEAASTSTDDAQTQGDEITGDGVDTNIPDVSPVYDALEDSGVDAADATVSESGLDASVLEGAFESDANGDSFADGADATELEGGDAQSEDSSAQPDPCHGSCGPHQTCTASADAATCVCAVDPTCRVAGELCTSRTSLVECVTDDQGCTYSFGTSTCSACPSGCLVTLLSQRPDGAITIDGMVVGANALYCLNEEATEVILSVPLRGGPATLLTQGPGASGLAVDSTGVYWGGTTDGGAPPGALMKTPLDGGPTTILANGSWPQAIALDSTHVYWADNADPPLGSIREMAIDGGTALTIQSGLIDPNDLAVDPTNVYWLGGQTAGDAGEIYGLFAMPLDGGTPVTLWSLPPELPGGGLGGIAVDATHVYWVVASSDPTQGAIMRMPLDGGAATKVATASSPLWIAVDSTGVYWTEQVSSPVGGSVGWIMEAPLTNGTPGTPITLASGLGEPFYISVDSTAVYFYNAASNVAMNSIMKVTK